MILSPPLADAKAIADRTVSVEALLRRICEIGGYASAHNAAERSLRRVWTSATPEQRTGWMG